MEEKKSTIWVKLKDFFRNNKKNLIIVAIVVVAAYLIINFLTDGVSSIKEAFQKGYEEGLGHE